MTKQVLAILPGDVTECISVADDLKTVEFIGDKGAHLSLPIEQYRFENNDYHVARYSDMVDDVQIKAAIKKHF
ncbi:TPA: hypothetical protein ACNU9R_005067 [Citrobacter freundii]|uniref:hypothetical protein n=1 Tax=Citrobacter freundii TaxID=546 RepID=UPI000665987D|nr:hypothetical protein [Citrobacter freundii]ELT9541726.1 hypothetical protein [Citrobacter freundii]MDT7300442.1 hypothetical protein [Citrobacter freundii]MDU4171182.1 hypothetical protein [Citrobacter freundii]QLS14840.1 hypothetical protein HV325_10730 [Citrobacter freundii]WIJ96819.1 hypothetical protein OI904_12775 [Citrobacter freundii]